MILYDVIYIQLAVLPLWMTMHMTLWLGATLVGNFLIDMIVLLLLIHLFSIHLKRDVKIRTILMAWVFGFICDFIIIIMLLVLANSIDVFDIYKPYGHVVGIVILAILILTSMVMTFYLIRYLMVRVAVRKEKAVRVAIIMAIVTVPYYILLPINITFNSFL
ncbi:MAG: hypothetical protein PF505_11355 [Vallitaleaceae bacterium]|jgi:hypothetical protein|nr:hypothetical protein [Vallitaleaceae bacterium]